MMDILVVGRVGGCGGGGVVDGGCAQEGWLDIGWWFWVVYGGYGGIWWLWGGGRWLVCPGRVVGLGVVVAK